MKKILSLLILTVYLSGCATYQNRSIPFKSPQAYSNHQNVSGLMVGGESYQDARRAEDIFGFDIRSAQIIPVQIVMENKSGQSLEIVAGQTFLLDESEQYWKMLTNREAVDRVDKATQNGAIASGAGRGAVYGTAAGLLLGLAIGVVSGQGVGTAALKGAALGGASGAVVGGATKAGEEKHHDQKMADDMRDKGVEGKIIPPEALASGFIFFPGETKTVKEVRLQIKLRDSGAVQTIRLKMQ